MGSIAAAAIPAMAGGVAGSLFGGSSGSQPSYEQYLPPEYQTTLKGLSDWITPRIGQTSPAYTGGYTIPRASQWAGLGDFATGRMAGNIPQFSGIYGTQGFNMQQPGIEQTAESRLFGTGSQNTIDQYKRSMEPQREALVNQLQSQGILNSAPGIAMLAQFDRDIATQSADITSQYERGDISSALQLANMQRQGDIFSQGLAYQDWAQRMYEDPYRAAQLQFGLGGVEQGLLGQEWSNTYQDWLRQQEGSQQSLENAMALLQILSGQAGNMYSSNLSSYQNQQGGQNSMWGGLGSLLGGIDWSGLGSSGSGSGFDTSLSGADLSQYGY